MGGIEKSEASISDLSGPGDRSEPECQESGGTHNQLTVPTTSGPQPGQSASETRSAAGRFQFPIRGLMTLTLAIAIGLAGRNWLPAKTFAGLLTIAATIIIFRIELRDLGETRFDPLTILLVVACCAAMFAALFG